MKDLQTTIHRRSGIDWTMMRVPRELLPKMKAATEEHNIPYYGLIETLLDNYPEEVETAAKAYRKALDERKS